MAQDKRSRAMLALIKCATPSLTVGGLTNQSVESNSELFLDGDGGVDDTFGAVMSVKQGFRFSSRHCSTVLAALGIDGAECTTLDGYWQKTKAYGTRDTTGHLKISYAKAYMLLERLSARQEDAAEVQVRAVAVSADGPTDPATVATASLPSGTELAEAFTMGPCVINGNAHQLESGELSLQAQTEEETNEGNVFVDVAYLQRRKPEITLTSRSSLSVVDLGVKPDELTSFTWYLRKLDSLGYRIADGTASHIKITCTGLVRVRDLAGDNTNKAATAILINPVKSGGAIITIDAASAIA